MAGGSGSLRGGTAESRGAAAFHGLLSFNAPQINAAVCLPPSVALLKLFTTSEGIFRICDDAAVQEFVLVHVSEVASWEESRP